MVVLRGGVLFLMSEVPLYSQVDYLGPWYKVLSNEYGTHKTVTARYRPRL